MPHTAKDALPAADRHASPERRLEALATLAEAAIASARRHGADAAELTVNEDRGLAVNVRNGEVETVEHTRDRGLAITVYVGQRRGSASTADLLPASLEATIAQAVAIARFTEDDPAAGLADPDLMARELRDFDGWHPWDIDAQRAIALGVACEAAGRGADARITNSEGAAVNTGESLSVYANSHGFIGPERGTHHAISASFIAGSGEAMQREDWYTTGLSPADLEDPEAVGRRAAERAVARLAPRPVKTGTYPVLFSAEMARSLIGHLLGAVSGGAQYRRSSFLLGAAGERLFPEWMQIVERPHLMRGLRSTSFDGDGVATRESALVRDGVLERYLLSAYSARRLGLQTTGNAGGTHNLEVARGPHTLAELARGMGTGLLVTELMGQGVNAVTGDYSRGAAGFWVEGGEIAWPVQEATIAGHLRQMFLAIEAVGSEFDRRSSTRIGPVLVGAMTVAGAG